jgi:hypothetical protein
MAIAPGPIAQRIFKTDTAHIAIATGYFSPEEIALGFF